MMFGYATDETDNYMPLVWIISQILIELAAIRKAGKEMTYLRLTQNRKYNRIQ